MERIGDILKISSFDTPKRITFDLSEDGTFYNVKIYTNIVDKSKDEKYEGCIECKSGLYPVEMYPLVFDNEDKNPEIFTITIPD